MKEIDFLPEWYKNGRRRQLSYRTQYIALAGVLVVMVVWNFIATHSISRARGQFAHRAAEQAEAKSVSAKLSEFESQVRGLQKKAESVAQIDSKIDVADVLAEMSFLIDEKVILSKVEFLAEKHAGGQDAKPSPRTGAVVRVVRAKLVEKREQPLGDVRFKVLMAGVAADASDVMALICKLEESPYFRQVVLSFSRDAQVEIQSKPALRPMTDPAEGGAGAETRRQEAGEKVPVSEFEISCYLANYRER
jgi:Tfp pilus assembly protein PilN